MRRLCLMIAATCCSLPQAQAKEGPGEAAIAFLEEVRAGKVNLDPGKATAISPHILEEKRMSIAGRLLRLGGELGSGKLQVGRERIEGDLAAALIWKSEGFDPSQMQVVAIGLVQRDGKWLPAPVPASFENCGIGYLPGLRKRVDALESWMIEGQVNDIAKLREESIARMRADIEAHLKRETLAKMKPREVLDYFLAACQRRNPHEIMGLVGGHAQTLPDNWAIRSSSIETATSDDRAPGPWRLLMSSNVLRVAVDIDDEHGPLHASIACLDPRIITGSTTRKPSIELVHLELVESADGLWQVDVPDYFWQDQTVPSNATNAQLDRDLLERFASRVREQHPAQPQAEAADARKMLIGALRQRRFVDLLKITHIPSDSEQGQLAILRAAEAWGSLHNLVDDKNPSSAHMLLDLAMNVIDDEAGVLVHAFSARKPDRYDPHALYLSKTKDGWLWSPNPTEETLKTFQQWSNVTTLAQRNEWRKQLLKDCPVVTQLDQPAPSEKEARAVVERWIGAIESGDVMTGLEQCAILNLEDSPKVLLRNLGYEVVDALRKEGKGSIQHVMSKGPWQGVGTHPRNPQTRSYSLYPVVNTSKGARVLLEIDLIASSGRGREFLNRTSLGRAAKLGEEVSKPLTELFEEHCRKCLPQL